MQTIKIKVGSPYFPPVIEIDVDEIRRVIKENPEILKEEKLHFVERMIGKKYWYIDEMGNKYESVWQYNGLDTNRLNINNIYWTESSCDKAILQKHALGNILAYIRDNEIELVKDEDWSNGDIEKFCIDGWDYDENEIWFSETFSVDTSQFSLAFYSQEDREKVIENCKEDLTTLLKK